MHEVAVTQLKIDWMIFCGKNLLWSFRDKRAQVLWKIVALNIPDFLNGVAAAWRLKIDWNNFVGKNLILSFWSKVTKSEFSEWYDNLWYRIFLIFFIKLQQYKAENDFDKIFVLGFKEQEGPEMGPKMLFFNLNSKLNHIFLFFEWSYSVIKAWDCRKQLWIVGKNLVSGFSGRSHCNFKLKLFLCWCLVIF